MSLRALFTVTSVIAMAFAIIAQASHADGKPHFLMPLLTLLFGGSCVFCRELLDIKSERTMVVLAISVVCAFGFMVCSFSTAALAACIVMSSAS